MHRRAHSDLRDFADYERPVTPFSDRDGGGGGVRLNDSTDSLSTLLDRNVSQMPKFDSPFWFPYMNTLRVFGTLEQKVLLFDMLGEL